MTETPAGYYTDADAIRSALAKHGPLSRAELSKKSAVDRTALSKSLYQLKQKGDVIEEGELLNLSKTIAKTPESAQDEPEEAKVSIPTTPPTECVTEQLKPVAEQVVKLEPGPRLMTLTPEICAAPHPTDVRDYSVKAVAALQALYDLADECRALLAENQRQKDWIDAHKDSYDLLLADRAELHKLKDTLRGLV